MGDQEPVGYWNWKTPTMGGQQFWNDVLFRDGWKIQQNINTGHHRLIDSQHFRHAWGDRQHCQNVLEQQLAGEPRTNTNGEVVILLHGMIRTHNSMNSIERLLQEHTDATVINFEYASCRQTIEESAKALKSVIDGLNNDVKAIHFIGHSLGNIVVRRYLNDVYQLPVDQRPPFGRMVMLGPPNQGSRMASLMNNSMIFNAVTGAAGKALGKGWKELVAELATPQFEFAIIAGGKEEKPMIDNWALAGPNDFTVSVAETHLNGAADTITLPLLHGTMMNSPDVHQAILSFLEHGRLSVLEATQSIETERSEQK
ncbi:MAG: alpha/beta hydrolase [Pirellulaceae bacterium]